jgi:ABC-2 type transport system ATP-binding protein
MKIQFDKISKQYNNTYVLNEVSFEIGEGIYGLLGTNGAGKTTLINIFMGILKSDGGCIRIDGTDVRNIGMDFLNQIGYLPQSSQFYRSFKVQEFMEYMCALKNIPKKVGKERIDELLHMVNLHKSKSKKIGALSGGMKQRLGIAQAMLNYPKILILDEPTAGLDPQERIRFRNLISKISENCTILLATHIVSDIEFIANEVIILKNGELIKQGSITSLIEEINKKVWSIVVKNHEIPEKLDRFQISNMMRNRDGIHLRIISDEKPDMIALNTEANLEDVFLYYCGEKIYDEIN